MIYLEFAYVFWILYNCAPMQKRFHGETLTNSKCFIDLNTPFDGKFYADSEFEIKIWFLRTHLNEKRALKNLRGQIQKIITISLLASQ